MTKNDFDTGRFQEPERTLQERVVGALKTAMGLVLLAVALVLLWETGLYSQCTSMGGERFYCAAYASKLP